MTDEPVLLDIAMPRLSDSMEEATVLRWLKQPGDAVAKGEPLVEVETDKATIVYEAEFDGVLEEIVVDEGGTAALGEIDRSRRASDGAARGAAPTRRSGCVPRPRRPPRPLFRRERRHEPAPPRDPCRPAARGASSASLGRRRAARARAAGSSAPTCAALPEPAPRASPPAPVAAVR